MNQSVNQNRQLYVMNSYAAVSESSATGTIEVDSIGEGRQAKVFLKYKGADTVLRSDYISPANIAYVKAVAASSMEPKLNVVTVTLDSNVNGGAPVAGQEYMLRISFKQFFGMSDSDTYEKLVSVTATSGETAEQLYKALETALNKNFSKEVGATPTSNPYLEFSSSASGLVITEKEQDWKRGKISAERVLFDVYAGTINTGTLVAPVESAWAVITKSSSTTTICNGKAIADLEYFAMGERGDQYRGMGFPNNIDTTYLVDASKHYDVLEIHYAFYDSGVNSYRSEKDITIVCDHDNVAQLNSLIDAFETATGLTIDGVSTATGD